MQNLDDPPNSAANTLTQRLPNDINFKDLSDHLFIVEHNPIYTLGRNATLEHLRFPKEATVAVVDRGNVSELDKGTSASHSSATMSTSSSLRDDSLHQKRPNVYELVRVERGGDVTYHGPGQIVLYPILLLQPTQIPVEWIQQARESASLQRIASTLSSSPSHCSSFRPDLHWYLRSLESVVIRFLRLYGIEGTRITGASGVWVDTRRHDQAVDRPSNNLDSNIPRILSSSTMSSASCTSSSSCSSFKKIAAVGLSCSSWLTMHGIAINIDMDMEPFDWIVPCGLKDVERFGGVTQLKDLIQMGLATKSPTPLSSSFGMTHSPPNCSIDLSLVRSQLMRCFIEEFNLEDVCFANE